MDLGMVRTVSDNEDPAEAFRKYMVERTEFLYGVAEGRALELLENDDDSSPRYNILVNGDAFGVIPFGCGFEERISMVDIPAA